MPVVAGIAAPAAIPHHAPNQNLFMPHPPGMHFGGLNRSQVPSSFVPMQVTRQSVHHQPKPTTPTRPAAVEQAAYPRPTVEALNPIVSESSAQAKLLTAKPAGSRLAIRFNSP